MVKVWRWLW